MSGVPGGDQRSEQQHGGGAADQVVHGAGHHGVRLGLGPAKYCPLRRGMPDSPIHDGKRLKIRVDGVAGNRPVRYCPPRHWMSLKSRHESFKCVSMTWPVMFACAYHGRDGGGLARQEGH